MPKGIYNHINHKPTLGLHWKIKDTSKMCGRHPKSEFKKGFTPWNKGTHGLMKSWNKGTHGLITAWNKGKYGIWKGEENPNWKGGYSENYRIRRTKEYSNWRNQIFKRDNYSCRECGKTNCYLTVHHIKSICRYPELALNIDNGITLCEPCHINTDNYKGRARRIAQ